jgi:protocatechuate 3,4-dioxygenase beta subunit
MNRAIPILIAVYLLIGAGFTAVGVEISGKVTDGSGNPIHGASVFLWNYGRMELVASTDGSGFYKFSIRPGMYYMRISADGYLSAEEFVVAIPDGPVTRDLVLKKGVVVSGVVKDKSGRPVDKAFLYESRESRWLMPVGPRGSFRITAPPGGILYLRGEEHSETAFKVEGREGEEVHVEVELEEGKRVTGRVMDMKMRPVSDASIVVESPDGKRWTVYPDDTGFYSIALSPSRYSISAVAEMCDASVKTVDLRSGGKERKLDFVLPAVLMRGRVRDKGGRAVPFARIVLSEDGHEMTKIADGNGEFAILVPFREERGTGIKETFIISARAPGFAESREVISPSIGSDKTIDIILTKGGWIKGKVVEEDGTPVSDEGKILLFLTLTEALSFPIGSDGSFILGPLQPGQHLIATRIKGRKHVGKVVPVKDGETTSVVLVLERPAVVRGTVKDEDGNPVADAEISVFSESTMLTDLYYSDEDGRFSFKFPGGNGRISIDAPGYLPFEEGIELRPGITKEMNVVLRRGYTLWGRVVDRKGVGIEDATIELFELGGSGRSKVKELKAGSSGFFSVTLVPGKEYEIAVSAPGYIRKSERVVAGKEGKGRLDIVMERI